MSKRKARALALSMTAGDPNSDSEVSSDSEPDDEDLSTSTFDNFAEQETTAEKRARMAKQYLSMVKATTTYEDENESCQQDNFEIDDDDATNDAINATLQTQHQKSTSSYTLPLAKKLESLTFSPPMYHKLRSTPTCLSLRRATAYYGTKYGTAGSLDIETGSMSFITPKTGSASHPHSPILSCSAQPSSSLVSFGMTDGSTRVYDTRTNDLAFNLTGHKSPVTALSYMTTPPYSLVTGSDDRCIRHYTQEHAYVETLYGHQSSVTSIAPLRRKVVSVGRDRTSRVWDVDAGTHGIYRPGARASGEDAVCQMGGGTFLTGSEDGCVRVWEVGRKKPVASVEEAHGGKWIVSAAGIGGGGSDVGVTGSWDGFVRFWGYQEKGKGGKATVECINSLEVEGYVNGVALDWEGRFAVVAVGREHRLGRWDVVKCKERLGVIDLKKSGDKGGEKEEEEDDDDDDGDSEVSSGDEE